MKRIIITGSTGMVGKNLLEHPQIGKYQVFAPTRQEVDLFDAAAVAGYMRDVRPDMVIHAAGKVGGILDNNRYPVEYLLQNTDIGRNVIWGAFSANVKELINLGSSCMYPRNCQEALTEEQVLTGELEPTNEGYAIAKIFAARLCSYISREYPNFHYKTLIPCNLYGRWDKFDTEQSHLIPAIIHKLYRALVVGQAEIEIWGDGTARREFMYAGDMAECLIRAVDRFSSLPPVMNVGLGFDFTINEYYKTCAQIIGFTGNFSHDHSKPAGMQRKLVDITKQKQWGWTPDTVLRAGIQQTYDFFLKYVAKENGEGGVPNGL